MQTIAASIRRTLRRLAVLVSAIALFAVPGSAAAQSGDGAILIAVGGATTQDVFDDVVRLSGKTRPRVLIIPFASGDVEGQVSRGGASFALAGAGEVEGLNIAAPAEARRQIETADIIWMSGGVQARLAAVLREAGLIEALVAKAAQDRVIIAGTSAGASILSDIMIETSVDDAAGEKHPILSRGLGLWADAIIDQHFSERGRLQRLTRAVSMNPHLRGVGVDEATGAVRFPDGRLEVIGRGTVTVLDVTDYRVHPSVIRQEVLREPADDVAATSTPGD